MTHLLNKRRLACGIDRRRAKRVVRPTPTLDLREICIGCALVQAGLAPSRRPEES